MKMTLLLVAVLLGPVVSWGAAARGMSTAPHVQKSCVTKEGIAEAMARMNTSQNARCQPKIVSMTASHVEMEIACSQAGSPAKSTGKIALDRVDAEHFKGAGTISTTYGERTMDVKWASTGKFVSSDCGDVKPN